MSATPHPSSAEEDLAQEIRHLHYLKRAEDDVRAILDFVLARDRTKAQELLARVKAEGPEDLAPDKVNPQPLEAFERGSNSANRAWRTLLDNLAKEQEE